VLAEMRITGLGVIDDALLEFGPGLTVLTGETGAGKTMVVAGLGLLFGGRGDAGRVRTGSKQAIVEGRLLLAEDTQALQRAVEAGAEVDDDGTLLMSRSVTAEGRSRAHLGGRSVPVGLLSQLAEDAVCVHGQNTQVKLLRPGEQRAALDRFAGEPVLKPLDRHRALYREWQRVGAELAERRASAREREQQADLLRLGIAEIEEVDPQPGEDVAVDAELTRLEHADALRVAAVTAHAALLGDPTEGDAPDAVSLLGAARTAVSQSSAHDERLADLERRLDELSFLASDIASELASYAQDLDADPGRLAELQARKAALAGLTRKYADTVDAVLAWADQARAQLDALDSSEEKLAELAAQRDALGSELGQLAGELSAARKRAAIKFGEAVTVELSGLAMPHAVVTAAVTQVPPQGEQPRVAVDGTEVVVGPDGVDEVELLLTPHAGAPARSLQKGASGGELSRVMLAVEVVFAGADGVPTLVFDEVDAGVGGKAAVEVGRRLARLARRHQVLVVTHLPQVAAYADRHLTVVKADDGFVTTSGVKVLEAGERVLELSRMLAGLEGSDSARAHAEELLGTADNDKKAFA
jgi:DNA repair protein RecN (Recombination protein N)